MGDPWKFLKKAEKAAKRAKKAEKKKDARYRRYIAIGGGVAGVILLLVLVITMRGEPELEPATPEVARDEANRLLNQNKAMFPNIEELKKKSPPPK